MKLEKIPLRMNLGMFLKNFLTMLVALFVLKSIIHLVISLISVNPIEMNLFDWWFYIVLLSFLTSSGVTIGAKRFQLNIAETGDLGRAKEWVLDYFSKNGLRLRETNNGQTILESTNSFYRLFKSWFGMELVSIKRIEDKLVVEGPVRQVELIEYKLRFGKPLV
uniref:hypothetical protein n=1 Tax=Fulvivirga sp. TaxID=1931237 RepID=UPI00404B29DB